MHVGLITCPCRGHQLLAQHSSSQAFKTGLKQSGRWRQPARCSAQLPQTANSEEVCWRVSRRAALLSQTAAAAVLLRPGAAGAGASKQVGLPPEELKRIIAHDFQSNQYYITGRLTPSVFADDCAFIDPTTNVKGVARYTKAVAALFDPASSRADLISIKVVSPRLIKAQWRFAASLNIPGKPKLKPYTGSTEYRLDEQGLVSEHVEEWDISALDAFVSILLPNFGAPPAPPVQNPVDL